jgi:hypothetical protein
MGQIQLTIALVMIGLFSVALIGFGVNFAADNDAAISLSDDPEISNLDTNIQGNLSSFRSGSESTYQSIVESSIDEGETTPSGGQFAITPVNAISTVSNILKTGYLKIFGTGSGFGIFITAFLSLIGFIMGLYLWKTWAGRNPE